MQELEETVANGKSFFHCDGEYAVRIDMIAPGKHI